MELGHESLKKNLSDERFIRENYFEHMKKKRIFVKKIYEFVNWNLFREIFFDKLLIGSEYILSFIKTLYDNKKYVRYSEIEIIRL
jgi:hypothetical protein